MHTPVAGSWVIIRYVSSAKGALRSWNTDQALRYLHVAARLDRANGEVAFLLARVYRLRDDEPLIQEQITSAVDLAYPIDPVQREITLMRAQTGHLRETLPHLPELLGQSDWDDRLPIGNRNILEPASVEKTACNSGFFYGAEVGQTAVAIGPPKLTAVRKTSAVAESL